MSDTEKHVSKRGCLKSTRSRIILAIVALIVIIVAVVPSVVVTTLHKKNSMGPKAKVFVPLYVYPAPGAWTPLENVYVLTLFIPPVPSPPSFACPEIPYCISGGRWPATQSHGDDATPFRRQPITSERNLYLTVKRHSISAHPDVNFTVVINPGNGPGPDSLPDANYTREIPTLSSYENVRLLGYVYTSYAKRNVSAIRKDIQTYADWPTNSSNPNLAVQGIFFDETPQQYEAQTLTYLQGLTDFVKDQEGLGPDQFVSAIPKKPDRLLPYHTTTPVPFTLRLAFTVHFFICSSVLPFHPKSPFPQTYPKPTHTSNLFFCFFSGSSLQTPHISLYVPIHLASHRRPHLA
jgi:hypothetical protein